MERRVSSERKEEAITRLYGMRNWREKGETTKMRELGGKHRHKLL